MPADVSKCFRPNCLEANPAKPDVEFELEHVYGYRTSDCTQNLRYNTNGEAVFMVAALGVVMNTDTLA